MKPSLIVPPQKLSRGSPFTIHIPTSITTLYFAISYPPSKRRALQAKEPSEGTWPQDISPIICNRCCSLDMGTELFAVTPLQSTTISVPNISSE